jgi:hypothetical protein
MVGIGWWQGEDGFISLTPMVRLAEPLVRVMVRLRPPKSLGFTGVLTGLRPGPYVHHPPINRPLSRRRPRPDG